MKTDLFERGGRATHLAAAGCHSVCGRERQRVKVGSVLGREDTTALHKRSVFLSVPALDLHTLFLIVLQLRVDGGESIRENKREGKKSGEKSVAVVEQRAERNSWNSNYIEEGLPAET